MPKFKGIEIPKVETLDPLTVAPGTAGGQPDGFRHERMVRTGPRSGSEGMSPKEKRRKLSATDSPPPACSPTPYQPQEPGAGWLGCGSAPGVHNPTGRTSAKTGDISYFSVESDALIILRAMGRRTPSCGISEEEIGDALNAERSSRPERAFLALKRLYDDGLIRVTPRGDFHLSARGAKIVNPGRKFTAQTYQELFR